MTKKGKGWTRVGEFPSLDVALNRQKSITAKGFEFNIEKGMKGSAWFKPHEVYRLWAREQSKR